MGLTTSTSTTTSSIYTPIGQTFPLAGLSLGSDVKMLHWIHMAETSQYVVVFDTKIVTFDYSRSKESSPIHPVVSHSWSSMPSDLRLEVASISIEEDLIFAGEAGVPRLYLFSLTDETLVGIHALSESFDSLASNSDLHLHSPTPPLLSLKQLIDQSHQDDEGYAKRAKDQDEKIWRRTGSASDVSANPHLGVFWTKLFAIPQSNDLILSTVSGKIAVFNVPLRQITGLFLHHAAFTLSTPPKPTALAYCGRRQRVYVGYATGLIASFSLTEGELITEFKGHQSPVVFLDLPSRFEVLISGSTDGTVRQWHPDMPKEIKGYSIPHLAAAFCDARRRLLFVGTSLGTVITYGLEKSGSGLDTYFSAKSIMPPLAVFAGTQTPIGSLAFDTAHDVLLVSTTSPCTLVSYRPFLNQPLPSPEPPVGPSSSSPFDPHQTDVLLQELVLRLPPATQIEDLCHFRDKKAQLSSYLSLFENPTSPAFLALQEAPGRIEKELHVSLLSKYAQQSRDRKVLLEANRDILEPQTALLQLKSSYQQKLALLREKHRMELAELEEEYDTDLRTFENSLPVRRESLATQYLERKQALKKFQETIDLQAANQLGEIFRRAHPLLKERYQIGKKIRPGVSSVFLGLDLHTMEHVAIKAVPAFISIDVTLNHPGLCPILDVIKTEGTTFLILKHYPANLLTHYHGLIQDPLRIHRLIYGLLTIVHFLGTRKYVYRDLRPSNILLDEAFNPILLHLGIMRDLTGIEPIEGGTCFASPEVFCRKVHATSDVFSIGVVWAWLFQTEQERNYSPLFPIGQAAEAIALISARAPRHLSSSDVTQMSKYFNFSEVQYTPLHQVLPDSSIVQPAETSSRNLIELCPSAESGVLDLVTHFPSPAAELLHMMLDPNPLRRILPIDCIHHNFFQPFHLDGDQQQLTIHRSPSGMLDLSLDSPLHQ